VKENIRAFGGDPHKVTVLGFSAGSGSTGLLSTTPMAAGIKIIDFFKITMQTIPYNIAKNIWFFCQFSFCQNIKIFYFVKFDLAINGQKRSLCHG
jgi:hypothetical protein